MGTLHLRQLFDTETSTYTYLLFDRASSEALLIDSVLEKVERDKKLMDELELNLIYLLETHVHADHLTGSKKLRESTGAPIVVGKATGVQGADIFVEDQDELRMGKFSIQCLATPGHTSGCMSFYVPSMVFTGDALLIRANGRTDFQAGDAKKLYKSITQTLYKLPPETLVYPGHDYQGMTCSTIEEEMKFNRRIAMGVTEEGFVRTMEALKLDSPKKMDLAVPANVDLRRAKG